MFQNEDRNASRCQPFGRWFLWILALYRKTKGAKWHLRLGVTAFVSLSILMLSPPLARETTKEFGSGLTLNEVTSTSGNRTKDIDPFSRATLITARTRANVDLSVDQMRIARDELTARKELLKRQCQTLPMQVNSSLNSTLKNMIIDRQHGISWCPIYKAASSSWMRNFAMLGGALTETTLKLIERDLLQLNTIVRQLYPREVDPQKALQKLRKTKKFLIVRHPIERLLSAYRDKLERIEGREYYYKRFGRHIVHKYRRERDVNETKLEPTFTEFLRFIIDERYFDEHWMPFFSSCSPCSIDYDYILKFETLERDQSFIMQELGLHRFLHPGPWKENGNRRGETTSTLVEDYTRKVPETVLKQIGNIFRTDFLLFSYSSL